MQQINYILVNETDSKTASRIINGCHLSDIGHHVIVEAGDFSDGFRVLGRAKRQSRAQGSSWTSSEPANARQSKRASSVLAQSQPSRFQDLEQRNTLIKKLCHLRKQHPEAKILCISELGEYCVHPSERMNHIRREMSDLL